MTSRRWSRTCRSSTPTTIFGSARTGPTCCRSCWRMQFRPQHHRHRVRAVPRHAPRSGPEEMKADRRDRVRQRRRRHERRRRLWQDRRLCRHRQLCATCSWARTSSRCWRRTSPPAMAASAASATSSPGTQTRSWTTPLTSLASTRCLNETFQAGLRQLAPLKLTFEAWLYHPQIPDVTAMARAIPELNIVLESYRRAAWPRTLCGQAG